MELTESQKALLKKIVHMPRGTVLRKGNRERILWGLMPGMIMYKTKINSRNTAGQNLFDFMKWAEKAEIVEGSK